MYAAGNQYLKPDAAKALEYLEKGAELGSNSAIILLADHLLKGDLGKQDIERARGLLEGLAVQDNAAASFRLGMMYCGDDGSGVPANPEKAVKVGKKMQRDALNLFQHAAEAGQAGAHFVLGQIYGRSR